MFCDEYLFVTSQHMYMSKLTADILLHKCAPGNQLACLDGRAFLCDVVSQSKLKPTVQASLKMPHDLVQHSKFGCQKSLGRDSPSSTITVFSASKNSSQGLRQCSELRHFLGLDLDILGTWPPKCLWLRDYKPVPFCVHRCHMFTYLIAISCNSQLNLVS